MMLVTSKHCYGMIKCCRDAEHDRQQHSVQAMLLVLCKESGIPKRISKWSGKRNHDARS
jgi:hypothetical protein